MIFDWLFSIPKPEMLLIYKKNITNNQHKNDDVQTLLDTKHIYTHTSYVSTF